MTNELSASMYADGEYQRNNPGWHIEDSPWKAGHIAQLLNSHSIVPRHLCEVGCGAGDILVNLARQFNAPTEFTGFELSPQAYGLCSPKATARLHFRNDSPFDSPFDSLLDTPSSGTAHAFDVAVAADVFEHVEDYLGFLRQMRTLAEFKVFHIPLDLSVQTVLRGTPLRRLRDVVGHLHYFTKETALASLVHAGYSVMDVRYTAHALELPNRGWKAALGRWPRKALAALNPDLNVRVMGGYSLLVLAQ